MKHELLDQAPASCYEGRMRPLQHPAVDDISVEGILYALSDSNRAHIFASIAGGTQPCTCSAFLSIGEQQLPKSTLSQHFKVLRDAGLIRSERRGVEMHNTTRCDEINQRFPGLLPAIRAALLAQKRRAGVKRARGAARPRAHA